MGVACRQLTYLLRLGMNPRTRFLEVAHPMCNPWPKTFVHISLPQIVNGKRQAAESNMVVTIYNVVFPITTWEPEMPSKRRPNTNEENTIKRLENILNTLRIIISP